MKRVCMALIRFYQRALSARKPYPTCRFTPTCSAYAYEAFETRGFFAGFVLTVWRLLRCSPLSPGGYDPVPRTGFGCSLAKGGARAEAENGPLGLRTGRLRATSGRIAAAAVCAVLADIFFKPKEKR